jgi:hypothetical protein
MLIMLMGIISLTMLNSIIMTTASMTLTVVLNIIIMTMLRSNLILNGLTTLLAVVFVLLAAAASSYISLSFFIINYKAYRKMFGLSEISALHSTLLFSRRDDTPLISSAGFRITCFSSKLVENKTSGNTRLFAESPILLMSVKSGKQPATLK